MLLDPIMLPFGSQNASCMPDKSKACTALGKLSQAMAIPMASLLSICNVPAKVAIVLLQC